MYDDGVNTALYAAIVRNNVIINPGYNNHDPYRVTALYRSTDLGSRGDYFRTCRVRSATDGHGRDPLFDRWPTPTNSTSSFMAPR